MGSKKKSMNRPLDPKAADRTLIYIPIIHTRADMGALSDSVQQAILQKVGKRGLSRKMNLIDKMWTKIEHVMDSLPLPYERVRLYQDGLPICGRELEIVTELAKAGSRNHHILLRLVEKGATIMGTESSELLVEEYDLLKQMFETSAIIAPPEDEPGRKTLRNSLLKKRDRFIAARINCTLNSGETGVLFLGMLHSLRQGLEKDIRVIYPVFQPIM